MEILQLSTQKKVELNDLLRHDLDQKTFVFGEFHYDKIISRTHAEIIWNLVRREKLENQFSVGWEFLEYDFQEEITQAFNAWKSSKIDDQEYLKRIFPNSSQAQAHSPYLDLMAATAKLGGKLIATNAQRNTKKVLMEQGMGALASKDQPDMMEVGSHDYLARFRAVMGEHVPENQLMQYFLAQYYTDNIIGTYLQREQEGQLTFLVIGSFHTDFNDGVVSYLKKFSKNDIVSFKIVNKNAITAEELETFKKRDPRYGYIADYLVIAE